MADDTKTNLNTKRGKSGGAQTINLSSLAASALVGSGLGFLVDRYLRGSKDTATNIGGALLGALSGAGAYAGYRYLDQSDRIDSNKKMPTTYKSDNGNTYMSRNGKAFTDAERGTIERIESGDATAEEAAQLAHQQLGVPLAGARTWG